MKPIIISSLLRRVFIVTGISLLAISVLAARNPVPDHSKTRWNFDALAKVPEKAQVKINPLHSDPQSIAAGRILYEQHCAECHGMADDGGKKAPNLRAEEVRSATPGALFWILSNGVVRHGMPDWSKLPELERWQIVTYLKSLPPATDVEPGNTVSSWKGGSSPRQ